LIGLGKIKTLHPNKQFNLYGYAASYSWKSSPCLGILVVL